MAAHQLAIIWTSGLSASARSLDGAPVCTTLGSVMRPHFAMPSARPGAGSQNQALNVQYASCLGLKASSVLHGLLDIGTLASKPQAKYDQYRHVLWSAWRSSVASDSSCQGWRNCFADERNACIPICRILSRIAPRLWRENETRVQGFGRGRISRHAVLGAPQRAGVRQSGVVLQEAPGTLKNAGVAQTTCA